MNYIPYLGFKNDKKIIKSLLISKFNHKNVYTFPNLIKIKLNFPIFDSNSLTKSRLLIIILDFIENLTGSKAFISNARIFIKKGTFIRCEIDLNQFQLELFMSFFNDFLINNSLLKYLTKPIKLSKINKNSLKLTISELELFFDAHTRRLLPKKKNFWLELDIFFESNFYLSIDDNIINYSQLLFCHNIFEWYLK